MVGNIFLETASQPSKILIQKNVFLVVAGLRKSQIHQNELDYLNLLTIK